MRRGRSRTLLSRLWLEPDDRVVFMGRQLPSSWMLLPEKYMTIERTFDVFLTGDHRDFRNNLFALPTIVPLIHQPTD